jgi:hypothetical protein
MGLATGPDCSSATGDVVTSRKLEEISSNLDDMSVTLEEIKDEVKSGETGNIEKLDKVQADMEKANDMIDDSLDPQPAEK